MFNLLNSKVQVITVIVKDSNKDLLIEVLIPNYLNICEQQQEIKLYVAQTYGLFVNSIIHTFN